MLAGIRLRYITNREDEMKPYHLLYLGHPLCGAGDLTNMEVNSDLRFSKPKGVTCKRCLKSMARRNKDGDW